jgi:hypothetical protein
MKAESISVREFISLVSGEQVWWLVPPFKNEGIPAKVKGPLIIRRFVPVNLSGWTTMMVEYWDTEDRKVYSNYVEAMTNELNGVFRTEEAAQAYPHSK